MSALVRISSQSVSGAASIIFNNVFSATYDHYVARFDGVHDTSNVAIRFRMRVGGSDNSTASSYTAQYLRANNATVSGAGFVADLFSWEGILNTLPTGFEIHFFNPFATTITGLMVSSASGNGPLVEERGGYHNQTTSYDGFTFFPSAGNVTAVMEVYGYQKS